MKKKSLISIIIVLIFTLVIFFMYKNNNKVKIGNTNSVASNAIILNSNSSSSKVTYVNQEYGFAVTLPGSWIGFTSTTTEWQGFTIDPQKGDVVNQTGPLIHIRDPKYTDANPRQDIPVMVFTWAQWDELQRDKIHIGAAPINPSRLGYNDKYVFALPARYNYAYLPGYEEVTDILKSNPLYSLTSTSSLTVEDKILLCGGIPNGSTVNLRDTSRQFIALPSDVYPDKNNNLQFETISGKTTSGYISNGGLPGEAFHNEKIPNCFSYYNEFDSVGKIDLHVKSVNGKDDYLVHFIITPAD